jgi:hypothetical protein
MLARQPLVFMVRLLGTVTFEQEHKPYDQRRRKPQDEHYDYDQGREADGSGWLGCQVKQ